MSAQHTPGRLRFSEAYASTFRLLDESVPAEHSATAGNSFASSIRREEDARRLVACWNYAEKLGWTTEEIEAAS